MDTPKSYLQAGADLAQMNQEFAATMHDFEGRSKSNEKTEGSLEKSFKNMTVADNETADHSDEIMTANLQGDNITSTCRDVPSVSAEEDSDDDQMPDISKYLQDMFESLGHPELAESCDEAQSGGNNSWIESESANSWATIQLYDPLNNLEYQKGGVPGAELIGEEFDSCEGGFTGCSVQRLDDMSSDMSSDNEVMFHKPEKILRSDAEETVSLDDMEDDDFTDIDDDYSSGMGNGDNDLSLGLHTPIYILATLPEPYDEITAVVKRDPVMGLGFEFAAAVGMGIYVMDVVPLGPADGILYHGDRIVSVNGKNIYHSMFCNAADVLAEGNSFRITFRRFFFINDALEDSLTTK